MVLDLYVFNHVHKMALRPAERVDGTNIACGSKRELFSWRQAHPLYPHFAELFTNKQTFNRQVFAGLLCRCGKLTWAGIEGRPHWVPFEQFTLKAVEPSAAF